MFNFDLGSVRNRLLGDLGFDRSILPDMSGGIGDMLVTYYKEKEKELLERVYTEEITSLETELSVARDSTRRLNRRSQKVEKENTKLKKTAERLTSKYEEMSKKLTQKTSQVELLTRSLKALHAEAKKRGDSLIRWQHLARLLYRQQFYGHIITYPAESGRATIYALKDNNVPGKYERTHLKAGTPVHCIRQDSKYVLIDFIKDGKRRRAYVPANNIRLSDKPNMKLVHSANPQDTESNSDHPKCEVIRGVSAAENDNSEEKKK